MPPSAADEAGGTLSAQAALHAEPGLVDPASAPASRPLSEQQPPSSVDLPDAPLSRAPIGSDEAGDTPSDGALLRRTTSDEDSDRAAEIRRRLPAQRALDISGTTTTTTMVTQPLPPPERQTAEQSQDVHEKEDPAVTAKKQQIRAACIRGDFAQLQELAGSEGGFLTDDLRQIAWPVVLGLPLDDEGNVDVHAASAVAGLSLDDDSAAWEQLPPHRDEEQVQLDVNRAFVHYPAHASRAEEARQKKALSALIVEVLRRHPYLCYFQGFHDICQVLLLVLPPRLRTPAVVRLAVLRIRDFMLPTIDAAIQQLQLLPDILRRADPPLWGHLRLAQHPRPFFALSGTLTMYAHDVQSLGAIARVFDVLLARPPAFSLYLFAAIVCAHRDALFATPADEPEMLHHILSKLPARAARTGRAVDGSYDDYDDYDDYGDNGAYNDKGGWPAPSLDDLIATAVRLVAQYPPQSLPAWRSIPAASVLKTASRAASGWRLAGTSSRPLAADLTVADGERLFYEHVRALERAERRRQQMARVRQAARQYRGPLRAVAVATLVGVVAVLLRKYGVGAAAGRLMLGLGSQTESSLFLEPVAKLSALLSRLRQHYSA